MKKPSTIAHHGGLYLGSFQGSISSPEDTVADVTTAEHLGPVPAKRSTKVTSGQNETDDFHDSFRLSSEDEELPGDDFRFPCEQINARQRQENGSLLSGKRFPSVKQNHLWTQAPHSNMTAALGDGYPDPEYMNRRTEAYWSNAAHYPTNYN